VSRRPSRRPTESRRAFYSELVRLLPRHPIEVGRRFGTRLEVGLEALAGRRHRYEPMAFDNVVHELGHVLGRDAERCLREPALAEIEAELARAAKAIAADAPFQATMNAHAALARLAYATVRTLRPTVVVETGVAYGVTSAVILQAMAENGSGVLHSIDLPPFGENAAALVGSAIPERLRDRWRLHRGTSRRLLRPLLLELREIDLFLHDSRHTYRAMREELASATPYLKQPGVVLVDDADRNSAFADWCERVTPALAATFHAGSPRIAGLAVITPRAASGSETSMPCTRPDFRARRS
jgi:predicted O-methyltransferase YrrM